MLVRLFFVFNVLICAGILVGTYKTNKSVNPHEIDFSTTDSLTTLHCYYQFLEAEQQFVLWCAFICCFRDSILFVGRRQGSRAGRELL